MSWMHRSEGGGYGHVLRIQPKLEDATLPQTEDIAEAVRKILEH
jgi:hypothetical protein